MPVYDFEHATQSDLEQLRQLSASALQRQAETLHKAGKHEALYRLLVGNRACLQIISERPGGSAAYQADLELAIGDLSDPLVADDLLMLVQLEAAWQAAGQPTGDEEDEFAGQTDEALSAAVAVLLAAGAFDRALERAQRAMGKTVRAVVLGKVARAFSRANRFDQALQVAATISDDRQKVSTLSQIVDELVAAGRGQSALKITETILHSASRADGAYAAVRALAQKPDTCQGALDLVERLQTRHRQEGWVQAAIGMVQAGNLAQALEVANMAGDGASRERVLYRISSALAEAGYIEQARDVTSGISRELLRANALGNLALTLARQGEHVTAFELASRAVELVEKEAVYRSRGVLRAAAMTMVLTDNIPWAMAVAHDILLQNYQGEVLAAICDALAQRELFEQALVVAADMPVGTNQKAALSAVVRGLCRADLPQQALEVARSIDYDAVWREAGSVIMGVGAHMGVKGAKQAYESSQAEFNGGRALLLVEVAAALNRSGAAQAGDVLAEALQLAAGIENTEGRQRALEQMIDLLLESGQLKLALRASRLDLNRFLRTIAAITQTAQLDPDHARQMLAQATRIVGWTQTNWREIYDLLAASG